MIYPERQVRQNFLALRLRVVLLAEEVEEIFDDALELLGADGAVLVDVEHSEDLFQVVLGGTVGHDIQDDHEFPEKIKGPEKTSSFNKRISIRILIYWTRVSFPVYFSNGFVFMRPKLGKWTKNPRSAIRNIFILGKQNSSRRNGEKLASK